MWVDGLGSGLLPRAPTIQRRHMNTKEVQVAGNGRNESCGCFQLDNLQSWRRVKSAPLRSVVNSMRPTVRGVYFPRGRLVCLPRNSLGRSWLKPHHGHLSHTTTGRVYFHGNRGMYRVPVLTAGGWYSCRFWYSSFLKNLTSLHWQQSEGKAIAMFGS